MLATPLELPRPGRRAPVVRAVPAGDDLRASTRWCWRRSASTRPGGGRSLAFAEPAAGRHDLRGLGLRLQRPAQVRGRASGVLFRLGVFPLFLFSGAFFPVSNLGAVGAWVARLHAAVARRQPVPDVRPRPRHLVGGRRQRRRPGRAHRASAGSGRSPGSRSGWSRERRSSVATPLGARGRATGAAGAAQLHRLPQGRGSCSSPASSSRSSTCSRSASASAQLIDTFEFNGQPVPYAEFVAPGMLAASAFNGALIDATFNTFFKLKYDQALRPDARHAADHQRRRPRRDRLEPAARRRPTPRPSW